MYIIVQIRVNEDKAYWTRETFIDDAEEQGCREVASCGISDENDFAGMERKDWIVLLAQEFIDIETFVDRERVWIFRRFPTS